MNATALAIINNEDKLESFASGYGIDKSVRSEMVDAVSNIAIVSIPI